MDVAFETPRVRVQQNLEPSDENFKGWDILAMMPDGLWVCVGESFDKRAAVVAGRTTDDALDRIANWR